MAEEKVVQAEMDPTGDEFKNMLAGVQAGKQASKEEPEKKPDVKVDTSVSSAEDKKEPPKDEGDAEETAETLKKQIGGLKAELTKRKGQHDKVTELEGQIKELQGQLKQADPQTDEQKLQAAIAKLSKDELLDKSVEFQDDLADGRAALKLAERDQDAAGVKDAQQQINRAKNILKALEKGREDLARRTQDAQAGEKDFKKNLTTEVDSIFKDALELHPSLKDDESPLFKAGDAEFRKRPHLMRALGQNMGELVSLAYAILRNPELAGGAKATPKAEAVRKDLIKNLDDATSKAFHKGGGSQGTKTAPNYAEVAESDPAAFEKLVNKVKGV